MPTPRECVLSVLAGEKLDRIPFIIWNNKLPTPEIEARLLELGACIIVKSTVWDSRLDGVDVRREPLPPNADGHARTRTVYRTAAFRERRRNSDLRGVAAHTLCRQAGLTQRQAASVLGMRGGSAVAFQIQRLAVRLEADPGLRRRLGDIEKDLAC